MKKLVSIFLAFCICISCVCTPSFARDVSAEEAVAASLKALGLFKGVSDTDFELNRQPTRVEAVVMLIRLLGKEAEATSCSYSHPFTDVPTWADRYIAYAYEKGISNGVNSTNFGDGYASAEMYLTFILRALGYSDGESADFLWDNPYKLSESVGIYSAKINRFKFLRADVALVSYAALSANIKNTQTPLYRKLISDGIFTEGMFEANYSASVYQSIIPSLYELSAEEIYAKCSPAVFYIEVSDSRGRVCGSGSGFFIDSNGTAVTNYHVIEDMSSATITHSVTEQKYNVEGVYDYSKENDWAVIKVSGSGFDYLEFGSPSTVVGGANVYTIGSPMGLQNTISQGIISNTKRVLEGVTYIQTSAPISKGSSGGAFINKYGHVIGITSAAFIDGENLGLCIPISVIEDYDTSTLQSVYNAAHGIAAPSYPIGGNSQGGNSYSAKEALTTFVKTYANTTVGTALSYCRKSRSNDTYIESHILLEADGALTAVVASTTGGDTLYFSVSLIGDAYGKYSYYSYEEISGRKFVGSTYLNASQITSDYKFVFGETSTYTNVQQHRELASSCLSLALSYVNSIFVQISSVLPGQYYSVADFGFTAY